MQVERHGAFAADARGYTTDERLREREFGVLDRLTRVGIEARFPDQAAFRRLLGTFYHRPPGGESGCDVILRLRSALDTISLHHEGAAVLIVCHQVPVLCFRYLIEEMDEEEILAIDHESDVPNCGVTLYERESEGDHEHLVLRCANFVAPLEETNTPVTAAPDRPAGAR